MLRAYGPGCDGSIVDAKAGKIPDGATWIDLEEPTREEEKLVERSIGLNIPTQDEMAEIEPSSRLERASRRANGAGCAPRSHSRSAWKRWSS